MLNNNQKYVENILDNENVVEKLKNVDILLCEHITFNSTLEEQIKNSIQPEAYDCGYNKVREALIKAHPEDVNVFDYVMGLHYFIHAICLPLHGVCLMSIVNGCFLLSYLQRAI